MGGYDELTSQQKDTVKMLHEILCAQFGGALPSGTAGRILPFAGWDFLRPCWSGLLGAGAGSVSLGGVAEREDIFRVGRCGLCS